MSAIDFWLGRHRDLAASLPGAEIPWLARLRETAIDRFADEGWPTMRKENWRHTSLAFMEQQALSVRSPAKPEAVIAELRALSHGHSRASLRPQRRRPRGSGLARECQGRQYRGR